MGSRLRRSCCAYQLLTLRWPGAPHIRVLCECVGAACVNALMDSDTRGPIVQRSEQWRLIVVPAHSSGGENPHIAKYAMWGAPVLSVCAWNSQAMCSA